MGDYVHIGFVLLAFVLGVVCALWAAQSARSSDNLTREQLFLCIQMALNEDRRRVDVLRVIEEINNYAMSDVLYQDDLKGEALEIVNKVKNRGAHD